MLFVDTNILVYAADENSPFHKRCYQLLDEWRRQSPAWYVTWRIIYEFLRVTTHPRVFRIPWSAIEAWRFIEAILASPSIGIPVATERHAEVAAGVLRDLPHLSGNLIHDAQTAILMREHGVRRIYTRDTDFHRFTFLEPVDPTGNLSDR